MRRMRGRDCRLDLRKTFGGDVVRIFRDRPVRQVLDRVGVGILYEGSAHIQDMGPRGRPRKGEVCW
jgi:hypothetical protein